MITDIKNIHLAFEDAAKHKSKHKAVVKTRANLDELMEALRLSLVNKTFNTAEYKEKIIFEPKKRIVYKLPFYPDRVTHHALMRVIIPIWDKMFIYDSYACREGKGCIAGSNRTMEFVRRNKYVLKCDISKFYPSVDHDILFEIVKKKIKCPDTLWLMENIIRSFPGGKNVPIGNYTSQWFGNLYMNEVDQFVMHTLQAKYGPLEFLRYCDDFCFFSNSKKILNGCRDDTGEFLDTKLKLTYSKCDIFPVSQGVDFLGYRHFDNYILLRKRTAKSVRKRLVMLPKLYEKKKITAEKYRSSVASTWGWLKHANTHNLQVKTQLQELKIKVGALNE